jgi:hypothetical protein
MVAERSITGVFRGGFGGIGEELKQDCQPPLQLLNPKMEVVHSVAKFKDKVM